MAKKKKGPTPRRVETDARPSPSALRLKRSLALLLPLLAAAVVAVAGFAALRDRDGDGDGSLVATRLPAPTDPGPVHVHGLGINPADGALLIATHTGTYRVASAEAKATRVGTDRQDTMGFTIVGPNRFLGSGHPDLQTMREQGLPPNLGLMESTDGGKTWAPISLLGEADFHVLRARGNRVYGFDSSNGRLLASGDGGRTWNERPAPGPLIDLAMHPGNTAHVVAATERGLIASTDGGRSWRELRGGVGLLGWPAPAHLYLVDGAGQVHLSRDAGKRWTRVGDIGGVPAAFLARGPQELYVALHDGTIKRSADGGRRWSVRSAP